jgi:hypothetical protein
MTFTDRGSSQIALGEDNTVESVSAECRQAAVAFMSGSGWDKLDLAFWLTGPYARAVRHARRLERVATLEVPEPVQERTLGELLASVHESLLTSLVEASQHDGLLPFADEVVERGHARKAVDADGVPVWVPVDLPRMRLVDRVRALFAADYLNAPDAYLDLYVCGRCNTLVFDGSTKRLGLCAAHMRNSVIVPREGTDANEGEESGVA